MTVKLGGNQMPLASCPARRKIVFPARHETVFPARHETVFPARHETVLPARREIIVLFELGWNRFKGRSAGEPSHYRLWENRGAPTS